jgi:hypothetical protein
MALVLLVSLFLPFDVVVVAVVVGIALVLLRHNVHLTRVKQQPGNTVACIFCSTASNVILGRSSWMRPVLGMC